MAPWSLHYIHCPTVAKPPSAFRLLMLLLLPLLLSHLFLHHRYVASSAVGGESLPAAQLPPQITTPSSLLDPPPPSSYSSYSSSSSLLFPSQPSSRSLRSDLMKSATNDINNDYKNDIQQSAVFDPSRVDIYHLIDNALWGEIDGSYLQGNFPCRSSNAATLTTTDTATSARGSHFDCNIYSSDSPKDFLSTLRRKFDSNFEYYKSKSALQPISMALYNIHSWKAESTWPHPPPSSCKLPVHLSVAESEESFGRFGHLFRNSFPFFDGNSSTNPAASIPRSYVSNFTSAGFLDLKPFGKLISGASFVASTCHHRNRRDDIVKHLRRKLLRVDGLGKCMHTPAKDIPEGGGLSLSQGANAQESLRMKQQVISNYQFYLAFENTKEPGYITEKVFDGLIAGTVPVYYGATDDCKQLFPLRDAIIYVDDFKNIDELADYLTYLGKNETAFEKHRQWRKEFSILKLPEMLRTSWPCRLCKYAQSWMKTNFNLQKRDKMMSKC